jgi:hypothetical protein
MRKREVTCVVCKETVSRRKSLAVEFEQRACRKHPGTSAASAEFDIKRRAALDADRDSKKLESSTRSLK